MDYVKQVWAWIVRRADDIAQLVMAGAVGGLGMPLVLDEVSLIGGASAAVIGRLMAYVRLGLNKE